MSSVENVVQTERTPTWVHGPDLWRVGFHVGSLSAIRLLSGLVDIHDTMWLGHQQALFFVVSGMNPITVYMATRLFHFRQIGDIVVGKLAPQLIEPYGDYLRTFAAFAVIWLILLYMYRKRTFIRV